MNSVMEIGETVSFLNRTVYWPGGSKNEVLKAIEDLMILFLLLHFYRNY